MHKGVWCLARFPSQHPIFGWSLLTFPNQTHTVTYRDCTAHLRLTLHCPNSLYFSNWTTTSLFIYLIWGNQTKTTQDWSMSVHIPVATGWQPIMAVTTCDSCLPKCTWSQSKHDPLNRALAWVRNMSTLMISPHSLLSPFPLCPHCI